MPRLNALKDVLSDINDKVIIWARFKADLRAIEGACWETKLSLTMDVSNDMRVFTVDRFKNDPSIKYFMTTSVWWYWFNFNCCKVMQIYYSNDFNLETRLSI